MLTKETEKRNKKFARASAKNKRVMVAQDVIDQLNAKRYKAKQGQWVHIAFKTELDVCAEAVSLQEQFASGDIKTCKVCGVGAVIMSLINCANSVSTYSRSFYLNGDDPSAGSLDYLDYQGEYEGTTARLVAQYFEESQIKLIDLAFEKGNGGYTPNMYEQQDLAAIKFGKKYTGAEARLRAIMENIIANKGTFKPEKLDK